MLIAQFSWESTEASLQTWPRGHWFTCKRTAGCKTDHNGNCNRQPHSFFRAKLCKMEEIKPRKNKMREQVFFFWAVTCRDPGCTVSATEFPTPPVDLSVYWRKPEDNIVYENWIYPRNIIRSVRENLLGIEISGWMEMEEKLKSFKEDLRNLAFNYSFSWASNISLNLFAFE